MPPAPRRTAGPARPHRLRSVRHATRRRGLPQGRGSGPRTHPGGLGVPNARDTRCPKPAACPTPRRTAVPARPRRPAIRTERDASAGRGGAVRSCPETHPGGLGVLNARDTLCPKPAACPAPRRRAGPARSHRLRSAQTATRWPGAAGRCGAVRSGRAGPLSHATALRQKARTSCPGCTCASSCGATHGTGARACWGRRATGATPSVRGAPSSSRLGRCVTHWRSDGTLPPGAGAPERDGALLVSLQGVIKRG